jgi:hypothetical protein
MAVVLNGAWARLGSIGIGPKRMVTLLVTGRRSGRLLSYPLIVADYEGARYLVAMLGQGAGWAANVRAAGGRVVLKHGRSEQVQLEEVAVDARAPILRRHLEVAPAARSFVPVDRHAPLSEFERVAAQFPVFLIRPA